jgi:hypothetical protein
MPLRRTSVRRAERKGELSSNSWRVAPRNRELRERISAQHAAGPGRPIAFDRSGAKLSSIGER